MTTLSIVPAGSGGREVERFDPAGFGNHDAVLGYTIEHAKRIRNWPALERAVDEKIEEQRKFIAWRAANIRGVGQPQKFSDWPVTKLSDHQVTEISGVTKKQAERIAAKLAEPGKYRDRLLGAEFCAAFLQAVDGVRGTFGTGENEWFTPDEPRWPIITMAREVLGGIDLDPATHLQAQAIIRAKNYFTKAENGLEQEWHGRVWLNPPYAQPLIADFVSKLCAERRAGRVTAAILLTHNYTDTSWFHKAASAADAICLTRGRIRFYEPDGSPASPTQGQAFFYFGPNACLFAAVFASIGFVVPASWPDDA